METRRHAAVLLGSLGLLFALVAAPTRWHAPCGVALFGAVWLWAPRLRRGLGSPRRWLGTAAVLVALGAWLGPRDASMLGRPASASGALAATTMVARALALVSLGASLMTLCPPAQAIRWLRGTRLERLGEVVLIALGLVPSLVEALRGARTTLNEQNPGWRRAPRRAFEIAVFAIDHAANLAESLAQDLSSSGAKKETTS